MPYVRNRNDQPLMPCSPRTARKLLTQKKAKVVQTCPMVIKLRHGSAGFKQEVVAALDTGTGTIGSAAVANGEVVYQAEIALRDDISKKMETRRSFRRTRRGRKTRYRAARFNNRSASTRKGRLPPSIQSKIDSHLREIRFIESILPVARWRFELASFNIHKITNPDVAGTGYQNGPLRDFYNVKQFVLSRDGYKCQSGQKVTHSQKLHVHHIIFRSNKGPDTPENLITLCECCHNALHAGQFELKKKGKRSATKHATQMGIVKSRLSQSSTPHEATFGYETKYKREQILGWPKTHANDAVAACLEDGETVAASEIILLKNHVAKGDYKQTKGARSHIRIPTGKLFGMRKGDKVLTPHGIGFINGKRSSGYFSIADLDGNTIHASAKVREMTRLTARSTTQIEQLSLLKLNIRRKDLL